MRIATAVLAVALSGCATAQNQQANTDASNARMDAYTTYANCVLKAAKDFAALDVREPYAAADGAHAFCYPEFYEYHSAVERFFLITVPRTTHAEARNEADESARNAKNRWRGEAIGIILRAAAQPSTSTQAKESR